MVKLDEGRTRETFPWGCSSPAPGVAFRGGPVEPQWSALHLYSGSGDASLLPLQTPEHPSSLRLPIAALCQALGGPCMPSSECLARASPSFRSPSLGSTARLVRDAAHYSHPSFDPYLRPRPWGLHGLRLPSPRPPAAHPWVPCSRAPS